MTHQLARPIIILGAGRSGTKLLRSILACAPEAAAFPREINYIWRHGNTHGTTDELTSTHARPEVCNFIRSKFEQLGRAQRKRRIIEKTCANTLRVEFVHTIFPDAIFIHLIRDGRAVSQSAQRRWQARPDPRYLLEKLRWVPIGDIPYYGIRYLYYQIGRIYSRNEVNGHSAQSSWGPRFSGIDQLVREKALIEICAIQWRECVNAAEASLRQLPAQQAVTIRYEDLVADPVTVARHLYQQTQLTFTESCASFVRERVHDRHTKEWQHTLSDNELALLLPHIKAELQQYGYTS